MKGNGKNNNSDDIKNKILRNVEQKAMEGLLQVKDFIAVEDMIDLVSAKFCKATSSFQRQLNEDLKHMYRLMRDHYNYLLDNVVTVI